MLAHQLLVREDGLKNVLQRHKKTTDRANTPEYI